MTDVLMTDVLLPALSLDLSLDWQTIALVVPVMLCSGMVHGALGLGFPMVATPIIAIFLDVKLAILITLLPTMSVNVASIYSNDSFLKTAKKYWLLVVASLCGAVIGAAIIATVDASPFKLLLAALILLFLGIGKFDLLPRVWLADNPVTGLVLIGLAGGFAAGTTNVMVAVLLVYFLSMEVKRAEMVSAMNLCFLTGKLAQIVVFYSAGLLSLSLIVATAPLALCAVVSLLYGQRIGKRISQDRYRRLLRGLLAVLAFILVWQYCVGD